LGFAVINNWLVAWDIIFTALDNAVQPFAVVARAVYWPNPSTVTTNVVPAAPGTGAPFLYQTIVFPAAGVMVAVNVADTKGFNTVTGAAMDMAGCVFTVTVTLAQAVVLQVPSALTK